MRVRQRHLGSGLLLFRCQVEIERDIFRRIRCSLQFIGSVIETHVGKSKSLTSSIVLFRDHIPLRVRRACSSQGPSAVQPSNARSTARRLPSPVPRTSTSRTISSPPYPSPSGPKTRASLSCSLSAIGENTPQNRSGVVKGGGGTEYERVRCVSNTEG